MEAKALSVVFGKLEFIAFIDFIATNKSAKMQNETKNDEPQRVKIKV